MLDYSELSCLTAAAFRHMVLQVSALATCASVMTHTLFDKTEGKRTQTQLSLWSGFHTK